MISVVTAQEMARIEKWALARGAKEEAFMREAGRKIAAFVKRARQVTLLVGKGNNGGDAYAAGLALLKKGISVSAWALYPSEECSPLNQKLGKEFIRAGGRLDDSLEVDLFLDGFLGVGFRGPLEKSIATAIERANRSGKPILAIDIPSGLNGTTGEGKGAIVATETVTLGLPKIGLFLRDGWNCTGKFHLENFGLSKEALEQAKPVAWIPDVKSLKLPSMPRTRHKYERGFVVGFGGSEELPGAVKLSGLSALHTGAGIVKIFSLDEIGLTADELICQRWAARPWKEALEKAQAVFVGPGLGRHKKVKAWLTKHLHQIKQPCVLDADALYFLPQITRWPRHAILTPHRGEMSRLLKKPATQEEAYLKQCQTFVEKRKVVLVLKGAPTFILRKGELPVIIPRGDPGMATAGSGDVLTGILAALLAQGKEIEEAALLGVTLHAIAGEVAAKAKTSYGYSASDLIDFLPRALRSFL
ncbi:MAG: NAD(P)H-hydrate dehydratase [Verrucomicrobiota bacterium]|nr:NAD(P)H-hydrate dehydratase [Verrucomicrobiota bacterium]